MAIDLSALSTYTEAPSELLAKAYAGAPTYKYVKKEFGVTGSKFITPYSSTITINAGGCATVNGLPNVGYNPSGQTVFTQLTAYSDLLSFGENICLDIFKDKAVAWKISQGKMADSSDEAFVASLMAEKMGKLAAEQELMSWQGNKLTGVGNLARTNGYLYYLKHTAQSASTYTATSGSTDTPLVVIQKLIKSAPSYVRRMPMNVFVTTSQFVDYTNSLINGNFFHLEGDSGDWTAIVPGFKNFRVIATEGLDGNSDNVKMVMAPSTEALQWNMDGEDEKDTYSLQYNPFLKRVELSVDWFQGHTVLFPDYIGII